MSSKVFFGSTPEEGYHVIAGGFPLRVDSGWYSKEKGCDPAPFIEFKKLHYPECTSIFAVPNGEMKCACGFEMVFTVWFCR
jgi:hypothetical protein